MISSTKQLQCILVFLIYILIHDSSIVSAQSRRDRQRGGPHIRRTYPTASSTVIHRPNYVRFHISPPETTISPRTFTATTTTTISSILRADQPPIYTDYDYDYDLTEFYPLFNGNKPYLTRNGPLYHTHNQDYRPRLEEQACERGSCYPATGNLLIGRENRLFASSTCGLKRPERFCIVSHLEETNCFLCHTVRETEHDPWRNHRIGQIIYVNQPGTRDPSWWQSENGKEFVYVQLDLEAEFHLTHMIIVFSTFRPAAMLIERSYDFGKTWHVYKYFAANCAESFPGIPTESKGITDVICTHRYSSVEPSKDGEVIFRVLPPNKKIENPYAPHIQNMLKVTNVRINFTKLHHLGDTLLDDREEIHEKYYYGIKHMVVRGSCSCYGHASRCLPLEGVNDVYDMVHGRCECTHNTKGLNCEECQDFYNDLPWMPALGKQTNACQMCRCSNHTTTCHFDQAVYEHSGKVSGGVCDNCQHNTQGQHCEECIPFYYRDPYEEITSPHVCRPCDCDPNGSLDEGICDSISDPENGIEAGACHCKANVKGRRCDMCKDGFWNLDARNPEGCQNCTCNMFGTIDNSGCNMYTGECTCKRLVTGKDCNQCLPETYGLSNSRDGCTPCNCDAGGALDNYCDVNTGQCRCRPFMTGRTCSIPLQNFYVPSIQNVYEAEFPHITECISYSHYGNCSIILQPPPLDRPPYWTGPGYIRIPENTELTTEIDNIPKTMLYDVIIRYMTQTRGDWEENRITLIRPDEYDPEGVCANSHPVYETRVPFILSEHENNVVALRDVCLEKGKVYKIKVNFERHRRVDDSPAAQIFIDSITLFPHIRDLPIFETPMGQLLRERYNRLGCNHTYYDVNYERNLHPECIEILISLGTFIHEGGAACNCNPTGTVSKQCTDYGGSCQCKPNVVGRQCDRCAPGTFGFGPEGCKACDCNSIGSRDNECDVVSGQCNCHPNTYGRECDQCQPGYWNFPNCQMCQCNGHAQVCDSRTGACLNCEDFTTGYSCDRCIEGYYGNPFLGSEIGCRPCRCPDTVASGHTHADVCELDRRNNDMICFCKEGYAGARCDVCADNHYGNPEVPGGFCQPCDCSDNINIHDYGNCDSKTGKCLKCLHQTSGDHCELCQDGFFGDALRQNCRPCYCDVLGTNQTIQHCDRYTGQCPCLKNVQGSRCNECIANHWKIASGEGCEPCDCYSIGSVSSQCNAYDGQCICKPGFGGRRCNECQENYWGEPGIQCQPCQCDLYGSAHQQCDRSTGQCVCNLGIGGYKCNQCARGYIGQSPYCSPCGECFDNWDLILNDLKEETAVMIARAKEIKVLGATGAYTTDFSSIENKLAIVQELLTNTTISGQDISDIEVRIKYLRNALQVAQENLALTEENITKISSNITFANVQIETFRNQSEEITKLAKQLKENATQLQEKSVEGALNLTREALDRVVALSAKKEQVQRNTEDAERYCKATENLINATRDQFDLRLLSNKEKLDEYDKELEFLNSRIPELNKAVCDASSLNTISPSGCDSLCGGAGCDHCGGLSCENGAIRKSEKALAIAKGTEKAISDKKQGADNIIRSLSQAKNNASEAYNIAKENYEQAELFLNRTNRFIVQGENSIKQLTDIINNSTKPEEIRELAKNTTLLVLKLDQNEIRVLGEKIDDVVASLEDVETIIQGTEKDLTTVKNLKEKANNAKKEADEILDKANAVVETLEKADEAQNKAQAAINQADADIRLAQEDLEKIDAETKTAELPANETAETVDKLSKKVTKILTNLTKKKLDEKEIQAQTNEAKELATEAHKLASQLKSNYNLANETLTEKAKTSESARARVQQLLQRATELTVDTQLKLGDLESMVKTYRTNDKKLAELKTVLARLNEQAAESAARIQSDANRYRSCTS